MLISSWLLGSTLMVLFGGSKLSDISHVRYPTPDDTQSMSKHLLERFVFAFCCLHQTP